MPEGGSLNLILGLIFLGFSAFFSSSEAAFLSLQKTRVAHLVSTGVPGAKRVSDMIETPERLLSTVLLGNNLVNVAFTAIVTVMAVALLGEGTGVAVATGAGTAVILLFGEIIPKTIAVRYSEPLSLIYARPLKWIETIFLPLVIVLLWIARLTSGRAGGVPVLRESITESELRTLIDIGEAEGTFESTEAEMLGNVFRFGDRQVREVMTPRTEMVSIERGANLREFMDIYAQHAHTRFPVYRDEPDNIIGIISAKDVLKAMATRGIDYASSVTDVIRDVVFVPETKRIAELFDEMRASGNQMAIAVDEYGGLAGLVTLKRLSEEVVGPVGEEGVAPEEEFKTIDENTFEVEGGMSIEEVNEELDIKLPEGDFDTLAGFILEVLGHIPTTGEQFEYNGLKLEVTQMKDFRIESIKITRPQSQEEGSTSIEADTGPARGDTTQ